MRHNLFRGLRLRWTDPVGCEDREQFVVAESITRRIIGRRSKVGYPPKVRSKIRRGVIRGRGQGQELARGEVGSGQRLAGGD